jgi:hypothetical protein
MGHPNQKFVPSLEGAEQGQHAMVPAVALYCSFAAIFWFRVELYTLAKIPFQTEV